MVVMVFNTESTYVTNGTNGIKRRVGCNESVSWDKGGEVENLSNGRR